jgi:hypothetical protein
LSPSGVSSVSFCSLYKYIFCVCVCVCVRWIHFCSVSPPAWLCASVLFLYSIHLCWKEPDSWKYHHEYVDPPGQTPFINLKYSFNCCNSSSCWSALLSERLEVFYIIFCSSPKKLMVTHHRVQSMTYSELDHGNDLCVLDGLKSGSHQRKPQDLEPIRLQHVNRSIHRAFWRRGSMDYRCCHTMLTACHPGVFSPPTSKP